MNPTSNKSPACDASDSNAMQHPRVRLMALRHCIVVSPAEPLVALVRRWHEQSGETHAVRWRISRTDCPTAAMSHWSAGFAVDRIVLDLEGNPSLGPVGLARLLVQARDAVSSVHAPDRPNKERRQLPEIIGCAQVASNPVRAASRAFGWSLLTQGNLETGSYPSR